MTSSSAVRRLVPALVVVVGAAAAPLAEAGTFDQFAPTGSMAVQRQRATATLLPSGKVLVVGGVNASGTQGTAELYNPATTTFTAAGQMTVNRKSFAVVQLKDRTKVMFIGGYDGDSGPPQNSADLYDSATGKFTAIKAKMGAGRSYPAAALLPNGQVLIAGGSSAGGVLASAELYNPKTGLFTATRGGMTEPRTDATTTLLPNGKVLITGGTGSSGPLASADIYDPATSTFTSAGSLMTSVRPHSTATLLKSGKVLIAGGFGSDGPESSAELFDPTSKKFTATGAMTTARAYQTATLLPNGKVLIVGGYDGSDSVAAAELYDPATAKFGATASAGNKRMGAAAALLANGKALIAGGGDSFDPDVFGGNVLAAAEIYTPTPAKPAKPAVKWALNKRKRLVTATVKRVTGVSYKLTAKLGRKTKVGKCKQKGSTAVCSLAPGKGKWSFSVTPSNSSGAGPANVKPIRL